MLYSTPIPRVSDDESRQSLGLLPSVDFRVEDVQEGRSWGSGNMEWRSGKQKPFRWMPTHARLY
jgi:hypothetical protein